MADWSDLPADLVDNIARRIDVYVDYVRFRAVCTKWRSSLPPTPHDLLNPIPWLMLMPEPGPNYERSHAFFNFSENRIFSLNMPSDRPWRRCCGSSHGWLAFLQERDPVIVLFNPFTKSQIQLPPITAFPNVLDFDIGQVGKEYRLKSSWERVSVDDVRDLFIKKIVLSTSPENEDFVAMAIVDLGMELAYWKKGEERWKLIEGAMFYVDVIFNKGFFYAVNLNGSIAIADISGLSPVMEVTKPTSPISRPVTSHGDIFYLVDAFEELLMVHRLFQPVRVIDKRFMVYDTNGLKL